MVDLKASGQTDESPAPGIGGLIETIVRIGLVLLLVLWCFQIVKPFFIPIVWGAIIAVVFFPLYQRLLPVLGGRRVATAAGLMLLLALIIGIPCAFLSVTFVEGVHKLAEALLEGRLGIPPAPQGVADWPIVGPRLFAFWNLASHNIEAALQPLTPQLKTVGLRLLSAIAASGLVAIQSVFSLIVAAVLLARSDTSQRVSQSIARRLSGGRGQALLELAESTVQSVAKGLVGVAIIQSLLAGIGFLVVGVPAAGLLALICMILSIVQIGPIPVLLPVALYVFSFAATPVAILYLIWTVVVAMIDNFLKPLWLGRGVPAPTIVVFMGSIGGFLSMGIIGLFVGSTVLVLGYVLLNVWLHENENNQAGNAA